MYDIFLQVVIVMLVVLTVRFVARVLDNVNAVLMLEDELVTGRVTTVYILPLCLTYNHRTTYT
jgi:hypothetical protein